VCQSAVIGKASPPETKPFFFKEGQKLVMAIFIIIE